MKKSLILACLTLLLTLTAGAALAEDLTGKLGVTARLGFQIPSDNEVINRSTISLNNISTDAGFIFGGGFLYGIDKNFAAEFDLTNSNYNGANSMEFNVVNISMGGQYRFKDFSGITPFAGAGLDILLNGANNGYDVDTTVGLHVNGGIDYFIMKNLALTGEMKVVVAPTVDIMKSGGKVGNFDPSSFNMTFGVRYFVF